MSILVGADLLSVLRWLGSHVVLLVGMAGGVLVLLGFAARPRRIAARLHAWSYTTIQLSLIVLVADATAFVVNTAVGVHAIADQVDGVALVVVAIACVVLSRRPEWSPLRIELGHVSEALGIQRARRASQYTYLVWATVLGLLGLLLVLT